MTPAEDILSRTATFLLAGGRGARLAPLTHQRSKPAVPFGDQRTIDFALANCLRSSLSHPSIITQYQASHLTAHVRRWWLQQSALGADAAASPVCVSAPELDYMGTADALFRKDVLIEALERDATDKMSSHDIGRDVLPGLVKRRNLAAFRFENPDTRRPRYWKDVGTLDSYYEASMTWLDGLPDTHRLAGSGSVVAEGVRIHRTAEVMDSILMPGVEIGPGARIRRAILDENVRVLSGARLGYESIESQAFTRTPKGVVVVPANSIVLAASEIHAVPRQRRIRLEPQIAR